MVSPWLSRSTFVVAALCFLGVALVSIAVSLPIPLAQEIKVTQLILRPGQSHDHGFELFSQADAAEEAWVLHAAARRCQPNREPSANANGALTRPARS